MNSLRSHIVSKIAVLVLAILLLLPTAIKFTHAFNHYKHDVCLGEKSTHLHKSDLDCTFYKFKFSGNFLINFNNYNVFSPEEKQLKIDSQYYFLSSYQKLHFSLRGPPVQV